MSVTVADLDTACGEVAAGGGKVTLKPESRPGEPIRLAKVADTEGNILSLAEYVG